MALTVSDICLLFARKGGRLYEGEPVTQLEHALQSASRAEAASASAALVCAALLHDVGHMLNDHGETPTLRGVDDLHQYAALPFLRETLSVRNTSRLLRCAVAGFEAQPDAAGWRLLGGGRGRVHREALCDGRRQCATVGRSRQGGERPDPPARPLRDDPRSR